MPTTTFMEPGTDATQDLSFFPRSGTVTGTIASATDKLITGPGTLKAAITSTNGLAYVGCPNAVVSDAGARIHASIIFSTAAPSTITAFLFIEQASDVGDVIVASINTNGTLKLKGKSATAVNGTTVLVANRAYDIVVSYTITSASVWSAKLFLNDVLEITTGNAQGNLGAVTSSTVDFGLSNSADIAGSAIMSAWYDNMYIDNGSTLDNPGDIRVIAKRPFANGTTNGFTTQIGAGGSGYGTGHSPQVNEQPLSQTNGWSMVGAGSAITEEYNIEGRQVGTPLGFFSTIVDYMGWVFAKSLANETASLILNNVTSNIALTSTPTFFNAFAGSTTYPAGTGTDIGIKTTTALTTVSLYEAGIVLAIISQSDANEYYEPDCAAEMIEVSSHQM